MDSGDEGRLDLRDGHCLRGRGSRVRGLVLVLVTGVSERSDRGADRGVDQGADHGLVMGLFDVISEVCSRGFLRVVRVVVGVLI